MENQIIQKIKIDSIIKESDKEKLLNLINQLGYIITKDELSERIKVYSTSTNKIWIARINGDLVGLIAVFILENFHQQFPIAKVSTLIIDEKFRSLGIGKKLLEIVEQHAKEINCSEISLECRNSRIRAHEFYLKNGYEIRRKFFTKYFN